jgi:hypothetical protein
MTPDELVSAVSDIIRDGDRTVKTRAEEIIELVGAEQYDAGYKDGESSMGADFAFAIDELTDIGDFDGPIDLANKINAMLSGRKSEAPE